MLLKSQSPPLWHTVQQGHTSNPSQTAPPTGVQAFEGMSLWGHSHSKHYTTHLHPSSHPLIRPLTYSSIHPPSCLSSRFPSLFSPPHSMAILCQALLGCRLRERNQTWAWPYIAHSQLRTELHVTVASAACSGSGNKGSGLTRTQAGGQIAGQGAQATGRHSVFVHEGGGARGGQGRLEPSAVCLKTLEVIGLRKRPGL